jgi:hypothetical protein
VISIFLKNTIREILRMSVWRWLFVLFSLGSAGYMGKVVIQDNLENTEEKIALSKARAQNFHRPTIPPPINQYWNSKRMQ